MKSVPGSGLARRRNGAGPGLMSREQRTRCQKQRCVGIAHNGIKVALVPEKSKPRGVAERRSRRRNTGALFPPSHRGRVEMQGLRLALWP